MIKAFIAAKLEIERKFSLHRQTGARKG